MEMGTGKTKVAVAPHAGAWIEIVTVPSSVLGCQQVAPHAGAWIEISKISKPKLHWSTSLPTRERGLKSHAFYKVVVLVHRRSPRGSVD